MKNILYIFSVGILVGLLAFTGMMHVAHAETVISGETLNIGTDTVWDIAGSPYILEQDVMLYGGATLIVEPGVEIRGTGNRASDFLVLNNSTLLVQGTPESRVSMHGLNDIYVSTGGTVVLEYTDVSDTNKGLRLDRSRAIIASSTISGADLYGIQIRSSGLSMWGSTVTNNYQGIHIDRSPGPFQALGDFNDPETGGIGNALDDVPIGYTQVTITNSIIENNSFSGAESLDWLGGVDMTNNWWGSPNGPGVINGANTVNGNINYEPWLTERPVFDTPEQDPGCCSNILFIPGLEASRLYRDETGMFGQSSTNRLWEPNRNDDVRKLFLDTTGSSTDQSIYAGGPINKAFGIADIYGSFMDSLDGLVSDEIIDEWQSYGYDWRKPIDEVVAGSQRRGDGSMDSLIESLEALAGRSRTGKVSIIAHSNGGLVAKYLVKTLVDAGKESLIDAVISVAVPYLGTPQAILGLLHGDDQSIAGGVALKQSVARELGVNMPSAYSLLPSEGYFSKVLGPTIAFASTTIDSVNDGSYPMMVDSYSDQQAFLLDRKALRNNAILSDISMPVKGNEYLSDTARRLHDILNYFSWPSTIARWAVVGWGKITAKGIEYSGKTECKGRGKKETCTEMSIYDTLQTSMGDGTVVAPSASYGSDTIVAVDLEGVSEDSGKDTAHANILGNDSTQNIIRDIISSDSNDDNLIQKISNIPHVSIGEPDYSQEESFLVVSTHSPVELHLYDSKGRHTGTIPTPAGMDFGDDEGFEDGLFTFTEEQIPGTDIRIQESDHGDDTFITIRDDKSSSYSVVVDGTGVGTFDYRVERRQSNVITDSIEYLGIPVTPLTVATGTIMTGLTDSESDNEVFLASSTTLFVDTDGDGSPDIIPMPGEDQNDLSCLDAIRKTIVALISNPKRSKGLIKRLDRLEKLVENNKTRRVLVVAGNIKNKVAHKKPKLLTSNDKDRIISMIDGFIAQFE